VDPWLSLTSPVRRLEKRVDSHEQLEKAGTHVVIDALRQIHGLEGVLCFGSYAVGTSDADSDVDLYALWHPEIPTPEERRKVLQGIGGIESLEMEHVDPGWPAEEWSPHCDLFCLHDLLFDLGHNTSEWLSAAIRRAMEYPNDRDGRRYLNSPALLDFSVILYDPNAYLSGLRSQGHPFPARLKQALVSENMANLKSSLADLQDIERRGIGNTAFHFLLMRAVQSIGEVLFAVNEKYNPRTKRTEEALNGLSVKPRNFLKRYTALLSTALDQEGRRNTAKNLTSLAQDLEHLLEGRAEPTG